MSDASTALGLLADRVADFERLPASGDTSWSVARALGVLGDIAAFGHERWLAEMTTSIGAEGDDVVAVALVLADARLRAVLECDALVDDTARISALDQHAAVCLAMGQVSDARASLLEATECADRAWGNRHASMPSRLAQLATACAYLNAWDEAESALMRAFESLRHTHGNPPADVLDATETLLSRLDASGENRAAKRLRVSARRELTARLGTDHAWVRGVLGPSDAG